TRIIDEATLNGEIPEIRPVFLGIRRYLTERKLRSLDKAIEESPDQTNSVVRNAAEKIIRGKSYVDSGKGSGPADSLRPTKRKDKSAIRKLEKLTDKRRKHQIEANYMVDAYPEIEDHDVQEPDRHNPEVPRSWLEQRNVDGAGKVLHHTEHKHHRIDRKFANIVAGKKLPRILVGRRLIDKFGGGPAADELGERVAKRESLTKKIRGIEIAQAKQEVSKVSRETFRGEVVKAWRGRTDATLGHREDFYEDMADALEASIVDPSSRMSVPRYEYLTEGGAIEHQAVARASRHKNILESLNERGKTGRSIIRREEMMQRRAAKYRAHGSTSRRRVRNQTKLARQQDKVANRHQDLRAAKQRLRDLRENRP
ncbi:hypothetical protein KC957_02960, partial [Candidatus Saccharibacteria bacterium]|nr:hypothetical protein [Candidatus Saccharibacteria bacterium]